MSVRSCAVMTDGFLRGCRISNPSGMQHGSEQRLLDRLLDRATVHSSLLIVVLALVLDKVNEVDVEKW
jgi:hypothetical protein